MTVGAQGLTCREVADFLADYLAGQLGADERLNFEAHLAECPECVTYLRGYTETIRLARDAYADDPAGVPDELVRAVLDARQRSDRRADRSRGGARRRS